MKPYADTNFLTRCYLPIEAHPPTDDQLAELRGAGGWLPIVWLHRLELANAFEQHVFAWRTLGRTRITAEMAAAAQARFREDCAQPASLLRPTVISPSDLEQQFEELCLRHTAKHGFRTYDLLHVASALLLDCDTFWSFDPKANKLAALEGLKTLAISRVA
ncbi:MAG: type II toxin-antitoxin system VapC family toxin [Verrucomicrobia bacterium]|nr:type II toxin-antitoxin system VapC family toxin [Verrucomicrobiota bacterium]